MSKNPFDDPNFGNDLSPQGAGQQPAKKKEPKNPFDDPNYGKDPGIFRSVADTGVSAAQGLVRGAEMLSSAVDASSGVSKKLRDADEYIGGFKSGGRRAEQDARSARIQRAEESGSTWEEVKAYAGAFAEAPIDTTIESLGTMAPAIAANVVTRGRAGPVTGGAISGAQGAGATKGSIYESVKNEYLQAGATPEEAEARAAEAQAYSGENVDQIGVGAGLGVLAGSTGVERAAGRLANRLPGGASGQNPPGLIGHTARGVAKELPAEAAQGGHEQLAGNIALQREGFDQPLWQGVAGSAALEGLAGGAAGGGFGLAEGFVSRRQREQNAINRLDAGQQDPQAPQNPQNPQAPTGQQTPSWTSPGQVPEQYRRESLKPSEQMGLDPNAGPMSEAASIAVDTGVTQQLNPGAAPEAVDQTSFLQGGTMVDPETGEVFGLPADAQAAAPQEPTPEARRADAEQRLNALGQMARSQGWTPAMIAERNRAQQELDSLPVSQQAQEIEKAASEAATSSANALPEPTEAQKEAGNYKKGHVRVQGLDVTIENPRGSIRKGKRPDGSEWQHEMSDHYGYIKRTKGADSEQVDVYVGPQPDASQVFVIDQLNQETGEFDEHKVMMGYPSQQAAVVAYKSNFDPGWQVGPVRPMAVDEFKGWLKDGNTAAPASEAPAAPAPAVEPAPVSDGQLDIKAITRKQIPDMTDAEIEAAIAHYGPRSKRTHKLQREQAKRKNQAPAPQQAQAPAPQQATEQPYVDKAVADSAGYEQRTNDRIERIKRSNDPDEIYQIMVEHGQDDAGHPEGYSRVQQIAKNRRDQIENPPEPGIVETSGSERQAQGVADNLAKANPGKSYRVERRQGGFGEYYAVIDNELNPPKGSNAGPQSDSQAIQDFIDGKRDDVPNLEEVAAEQAQSQGDLGAVPVEDARRAEKRQQARDAGKQAAADGDERNPPDWMDEELGGEWLAGYGDGIAENQKAEPEPQAEDDLGAMFDDVLEGVTGGDRSTAARTIDQLDSGELDAITESARYLKDFAYSAGQIPSITKRGQAILSRELGKSGRDSLLMAKFNIDREAAHTINNRLDSREPQKLRQQDMRDAYSEFPGLRQIVEDAVFNSDSEQNPEPAKPRNLKEGIERARKKKAEEKQAAEVALREAIAERQAPAESETDPQGWSSQEIAREVPERVRAIVAFDGEITRNQGWGGKTHEGAPAGSRAWLKGWSEKGSEAEQARRRADEIKDPSYRNGKQFPVSPEQEIALISALKAGYEGTNERFKLTEGSSRRQLADAIARSPMRVEAFGKNQYGGEVRMLLGGDFDGYHIELGDLWPEFHTTAIKHTESGQTIATANGAEAIIRRLSRIHHDVQRGVDPLAGEQQASPEKGTKLDSEPSTKPSVIDKVKARKASDAVDDTAIREQIEAIAARWENELGDEGMAAAVRGGLRLPRRQTEAQLAFQQTKLDEALAKKNGTEAPVRDDYTLESVVAKNQREGKDYQEASSHPEFKQLYEVAGKAVDDVVTYLNDNGYSINRHWEMPEAAKDLTRKTKGMTGVMSRVTKKAVAVIRDYKRANPKQMEEAVQEAQADINEIRSLLGQPKFDFDPFNVPGGQAPDSESAPAKGKVGGKLSAGEVVLTSSGRKTTPFPRIDFDSDRKAGNTVKRVDQWLMQNALDEARARGDDFNARQFEANLSNPSQADKDGAEEYLFGEQPDVLPPITKPLSEQVRKTKREPESAGEDLDAMFDDVLDEVTGGGEADAPRSITQIDDDEFKRIQESARYLKDFAYSAGELPSIDTRAKVALSKELGKSGRDTLLMAAFNIDRDAAHTINNSLDDRQPRQLRRQDMAEAYSEFPGLREIVQRTVYGNEPQAGERREKTEAELWREAQPLIELMRSNAETSDGSFRGKPTAPVELELVDKTMEVLRRLTDAEVEAIAAKHDVPADMLHSMLTGGRGWDAVLAHSEGNGDMKPAASALRQLRMRQVEAPQNPAPNVVVDRSNEQRGAGEALGSAAKNTAKGLTDAIDALGQLFGGGGRLSSGLTFDEDTYAKAKPLFLSAVSHLKTAGQDLRDTMKAVVQMVVDRFGADTAKNMKPYVVRFIEDVRDGNVTLEGVADERSEVRNDGPEALDEVAPEQGGRSEGRGAAGSNAANGGQTGSRDGAGADGAGLSATRGGRSGSKRAGTSKTRSGSQSGAVGAGGRSGAGSDLQADSGQVDVGGEPTSKPNIPATNFEITDEVGLGKGGEVQKFNDNLAAIRVIKQLEAEKRRATPDEQAVLAKYVGWGGLSSAFPDPTSGKFKDKWKARGEELRELLTDDEYKAARRSTRNAHYTSQSVVSAMWKAVERMGFKGGLVLESSMGTGNFLGLSPKNIPAKFIGVEYDSLTSRIAGALYPQATVLHSGFQKVPLTDNSFALNIGNPPFGSESLRFQYKPELKGVSIHNQFFRAGMDALRPGGIQAMVVSRYLMDAQDKSSRLALAKEAELVGAIRLPDTAFKENARTEVVTDIIFLQKRTPEDRARMEDVISAYNSRPKKGDKERERQALADQIPAWVETDSVPDPLGGEPMRVNAYFKQNPDNILGTLERSGSMQHGNDITVRLDNPEEMGAMLDAAIERLPEGIQDLEAEVMATTERRFAEMSDALRIALANEEVGHVKFDEDGGLVRVIEYETPEGGYELKRQPVKEGVPWHDDLALGADGKWYVMVAKEDEKGNKVKVLKNGKPTKLNVYERKVFDKESDIPKEKRLSKLNLDRLTGIVKLRDLLKRQLELETADAAKVVMEGNRKALKREYDAFVKKHGPINASTNLKLAMTMPDGGLVAALEVSYQKPITKAQSAKTGMPEQPEKAEPAPILEERVVPKYEPASRAESPSDALAISLSETGRVSMPRIAALLGVDESKAAELLQQGDSPLVFFDPERQEWETADAYLSGMVKRKLKAASQHGLDANVRALEAVIPEDWTAENVAVQIGATWVPPRVYAEFAEHITGGNATASFSPLTNSFALSVERSNSAVADEWSADGAPADYILSRMMNSQPVKVTYRDAEGKTHVDKERTSLAILKSKEIASEFEDWIFKDSDRRAELVELFNENFNVRVNRQYNGQHLTLPGKVPDSVIKMRRHQLNAIWRGIYERFMLVDHAVGAGKTFTAIARAMERRRMGLSQKPMIVVPNHLVEQWQADVYKLYPGAKVLAAGKKDFEKKNRRKLFGKIATGDWDIVIVPHSSFGFIGISPDTEQRYLEAELKEAMDAVEAAWEQAKEDGTDSGYRKPFGVKEAERLAEKIQARMDKLNEGVRDRLLTFEQLGVDDLTVDEAHEFKNLAYSSRLTGVSGMGDKVGSRKANDLYNKIRVLRENPNSSVTFLTGTPISNSAVEMFTMLRYLAADELNELGMTHFDAFRSQFVEATPAFEPTDTGRLKEVTRLGRTWSNMRSLMDLYYEVTDAVTLDDIKGWYAEDHGGKPFPVPKVKGGKDRELRTIQPTPAQDAALKVIMDGFDSLENINDTKERNAERLRLMDRARKVSLDVRAVDNRNPSKEEGGKLEVVSKEVKRIYDQWNDDKGTQLIFLDRSVPKSNSDAKLIREYDKAVAGRDKALAEGNEADLQKYSDKLEAFDENEMEELKTAQNGGWNAYQQIKDNLVAMGIPANEIRFVQEANNDEQKAALFDSVNSGKVRVLIGSTPRMGAGTNVQKRAVALHHVDVTWKPSDIEQREGRIIRQGNELLEKYGPDMEVEILAYATERTVDAKMWDLNATKLRTINGIRKYDGAFSMDFEDEESVGMAEMAALASGNPLLMERVTLESEINNLELQERAHRRKMWGLKDSLNQARNAIEKNPARIKQANERSAKVKAEQQRIADKFKTLSVNVEGETYTDRDAAMEAVKEAVELQQEGNPKARYAININGERVTSKDAIADAIGNALGDSSPFEAVVDGETFLRRSQAFNRMTAVLNEEYGPGKEVEGIELGTYKGFRLVADISVNNFMQSGEQKDVTLSLMDGDRVMVSDQTANTDAGKPFNVNSITTTMVRLDSALNNFASNTEALRLERQLESARTQVADLEARADEPFPKAEELAQKRERLKEVVSELDGKDSKPEPGEPAGDSDPAFRRARGATPNRMNRARVEPVVDELLKGWKGKPKIHVVNRIYELPQKLQEEIRAAGAELDFRGVLWKNEVYILAPRLENRAQLEEVVLHEVVGHYGLRGIMGREMVPLLTQVYKDLGNSEKANELKQTYFNGQFNDRSLKHRLTVAEELIAHLAETGEHRHQTLLRKIVDAVRKGLRRLGFEMKITRTDLLNLLAASEQAVRSGNMSRPSKHDINFRRAYHGTPHQFDQFSLEAIGTGEGAQAFGWGLYFASKRSVAEFYRDNVTAAQNDYFANYDQLPDEVREIYMKFSEDWEDDPDAAETYQWQFEAYGWTFEYDMYGDPVNLRPLAGEGNLYQVEIPDDDKLLDWERRLDDQNPGITEAVRAVTDEHHGEGTFDNWMEALGDGGDYRNWRDNLMEDVEDRELSLRLGAKGVPGLRYLDADSRIADADGNTYNYVIWDDRVVSVQAVNDEIDQAQAAFRRTEKADAGEQTDTGQEPLFSRKPSEASRKQAAAAFGKKTARSLKGKLADLKPAGLGALPLMYLRDFAPKTMTALDDYLDQKREMDAMRNEMHARYDKIAKKWLEQRVKGSNLAGKAKLLAGITPKTAPDLDRLMHDSTIAGVDPSVDMSKQTRIPPEWKQLRERFLALPEEQQALFEEVRDAYKDQVNLLEDVIKENVRKSVGFAMRRAEREFEAEVQKARDEMEGRERELAIAAAEKRYRGRLEAARAGEYSRSLMLRKVFESMRVDEPYFPLKRFGDYFVALRDKDGNLQSFSMFEKAADMEDAADQLREQYPDLEVTVGRKSNKEELQNAIDPNFVADVQELVAEHSGDWDLADGIYQLYLQTLPDFSMRKGFIHRKKVHGYNEDAMRSFASSMFHSSYQIARLKHKLEMDELVEIAEEQAQDAEDSVDAMTVANELRRRHEWVMNPQGGQIAQNITSLAFAWQLGVTPAAALVNTTQTYMMGIPILGTRFKSEAKATKELLKASKDFVTGRGHIEKKLSGDERKAFDEFMRMGLIDKTQSHDLAGVGETGVEYNAVRHKVMSGISFLFHHAERYNREVTAMAAYRMARESGMSHRDATKEAADLTWQVHFDYSSGNRARYMQSDTAKILLVFRQHSVNMLARLAIDARQMFKGESKEVRREAFRRMAGIFGMFALGAGMMGVPGAQALLIVLNAMADDDDDPWTFEDKMRNAIYESLGETLGGMVLQGVPGTLTNTNLTDRIGMGHLWFFSPYRELEGRDAYYFWMEQVLGAFPGMIGGFFTGLSVMNEGHFWRGIETMAPKALKDGLRAWRYSDEGVQSLNGFTMYDEVDLWSSVAQAMGFMPAHIAQGYERNSALKGAEQRILKERQNILNRYALAVRTSDTEARSRLNERIREFNRRNPRVAITFDTIRNSLMRRTETGIRAEGGVLIDKRLNYLRDELPSL